MRFDRIVCPIDFSEDSRAAFNAAVTLAHEGHASLILVHVVEEPTQGARGIGIALSDLARGLHAVADGELQRWRQRAVELGVEKTEAILRSGVPWDGIVAVARAREADLVVIGTRGRNRTTSPLIGSVAERVVRNAPCTVLVVRPVPLVN